MGLVTLLIGHRGVGKSTFLAQLGKLNFATADLDQEIETRAGQTIANIFSQQGEAAFRKLEQHVLEDLMNKAKLQNETVWIALGAGFPGPLPKEAQVLWLRRLTDELGRSFLNRPRLRPALSPWAESIALYQERHMRFGEWAKGRELFLPEGDDVGHWTQPKLWQETQFDLTLPVEGTGLVQKMRRLELREDLLSAPVLQHHLQSSPHRLIYSQRNPGQIGELPSSVQLDFPLELGHPPERADIISLHDRSSELSADLSRLQFTGKILKLAVEIQNFSELWQGHLWWLQDPERRAFLPRSPNGRWRWYRSLFGPLMPLHYVREGDGSAPDQPLLWQSVLQPRISKEFAAVLGDPIDHSRSPMEHLHSIAQVPFVPIAVTESEWDSAWPILLQLGLRFAAVTSPLKTRALSVCTHLSSIARTTGAVNTLLIGENGIHGENTDVQSLEQIRQEIPPHSTVMIWGGRGLKPSLETIWPQGQFISARQGLQGAAEPDLLIWAVGRSRDFLFPSEQVRPRFILDLNYTDDSPGLEWAVMRNLPYQSGLRMFKLQAALQRRFWTSSKGD